MIGTLDFNSAHDPHGPSVEDRLRSVADATQAVSDPAVASFLWDAVEVLGEADTTLLDLHLRHGLDHRDLADDLAATADPERELARLRSKLDRAVTGRMLWNGGNPVCEGLAALLVGAEIADFDRGGVEVIDAHGEICLDCAGARVPASTPATLFAALPAEAAPEGAKETVAAALAAAGLPMSGSSAWTPTESTPATTESEFGWNGATDVAEVAEFELPPWAADPTPIETARSRRNGGRVRQVLLAAAAALVLVAGVGVVVAQQRLGTPSDVPEALADDTGTDSTPLLDDVAGDEPEVTSAPTTAAPSTKPPVGKGNQDRPPATKAPTGDDTKDGAGDDGKEPPADPSPDDRALVAPGPKIVSFSAGASSVSWQVSGEGTVKVSGPGLSSSSKSGSKDVCPGKVVDGECDAKGSFTYKIQVFDSKGRPTDSRSATMRMG